MRLAKTTFLLICAIAIGCSTKSPEERYQEQMSAQFKSKGIDGNPEMFEIAQRVRYGMPIDEAIKIIGSEGERKPLSNKPELTGYENIAWQGQSKEDFFSLDLTIKDDKVSQVMYFDGPNSYGDNQFKRVVNMKTVEQKE